MTARRTTNYVVEVHYDNGSRQLFGDPLFFSPEAAAEFGVALMETRDRVRQERADLSSGLATKYLVLPVNIQL